jgi:hypothetical protein
MSAARRRRRFLPKISRDITVSPNQRWRAVIYSAADGPHIAMFSIDAYGDLRPAATASAIGFATFNGMALQSIASSGRRAAANAALV